MRIHFTLFFLSIFLDLFNFLAFPQTPSITFQVQLEIDPPQGEIVCVNN